MGRKKGVIAAQSQALEAILPGTVIFVIVEGLDNFLRKSNANRGMPQFLMSR